MEAMIANTIAGNENSTSRHADTIRSNMPPRHAVAIAGANPDSIARSDDEIAGPSNKCGTPVRIRREQVRARESEAERDAGSTPESRKKDRIENLGSCAQSNRPNTAGQCSES